MATSPAFANFFFVISLSLGATPYNFNRLVLAQATHEVPAIASTSASSQPALRDCVGVELDLSPPGASEVLVLVISNSTDAKGNQTRVIVFLGRSKNFGWEAIGTKDRSELRRHWLTTAARRMPGVDFSVLDNDGAFSPAADASSNVEHQGMADRKISEGAAQHAICDQHRKILLSVDLSIRRFIRAYEQIELEFADQLNDEARTVDLVNNQQFIELRNLGMKGLFGEDSLTARVIRNSASTHQQLPTSQKPK